MIMKMIMKMKIRIRMKMIGDGEKKKNVLNFYMNNINQTPTPREIEILESYEADTSKELIIYAMEKAVENKARSMRIYKGDTEQLESQRHNNSCRSKRRIKRKETQSRNRIS